MAESKMPARIWAHPPASTKGCVISFTTPSADYKVEFIRADLVEPLVEALRFYSGIHEPGLSNPNEGPWGVYSTDFGERARTALQAYEAAQ